MSYDPPPAANPSAMLPYGWQDEQVLVEFPTDLDRKLFTVGLNAPDGVELFNAWRIAYEAVAETIDCGRIDCGDFYLGRIKGVVSPLVAIIRARREIDNDGELSTKHVWLRHSQTAHREDFWDYCVEDGNPSGKGGSYRGTIVGAAGDLNTYTVKVETEPVRCRVTPGLLLEWERFDSAVRGGEL